MSEEGREGRERERDRGGRRGGGGGTNGRRDMAARSPSEGGLGERERESPWLHLNPSSLGILGW